MEQQQDKTWSWSEDCAFALVQLEVNEQPTVAMLARTVKDHAARHYAPQLAAKDAALEAKAAELEASRWEHTQSVLDVQRLTARVAELERVVRAVLDADVKSYAPEYMLDALSDAEDALAAGDEGRAAGEPPPQDDALDSGGPKQ